MPDGSLARTDVAIVGAGMAGLATAHALGRRGIGAVVLEREAAIGRFASGRGAGLGRQLAEDDDTTALTVRGAALLRTEFAPAWLACGGILTFDDVAAADAYAARAARANVPVARWTAADVIARWPAADGAPIAAALWIPSDGVIDVAKLLARFADGARIECGAGVTSIEVPGADGGAGEDRVRLRTARGDVVARVVVEASGAWAGALTADPPLDAFKRHLYVLEAAAPAEAPFWWHLGAGELYVRPAGDGVLASPCDGALLPPHDAQPDDLGLAALHARFAPTGLAELPVARAWACQRAFAADRRMRLGRDPQRPWLVWAAALGGHGATAAAAVGERVAAAVAEALG